MTSDPDYYGPHNRDKSVTCSAALESMMPRVSGCIPSMALYWWGAAFKYLWRWPCKGQPISDIDKCIDCLERMRVVVLEASDD